MLDGLLGRGFTSKCKSSIKLTKARIDVIRRKRNAMQKFLKKDVADLLGNGLDINAYGRAEGLLVELNLSWCYDIVEQFCLCILKQISIMQKQRECPEECREAVPSLMFAAARFADLPELRDLRQLFAERYGNSLESFVNQEFAEKMAAKPPTREKKLQLMRDIAKEFSIKWDSKAFEQKMSNPPAYVQDQSKKQGSFHDSNDGYKLRKMEDTVPEIDTQDVSSQGRRELTHDGYKSHSHREDTVPKKDNQAILSNGRREFSDDGHRAHNGRGDTTLKRDNQDIPTRGRRELTYDEYKLSNEREDTISKRELTHDGYKSRSHREDSVPKKDNQAILSNGRREFSDDGHKVHNGRGDTTLKRDIQDIPTRGRRELTDDGYKLPNEREDTISKRVHTHDGYKSHSHREYTVPKKDNEAILSNGRREFSDDGRKVHNSRGDTTLKRDNQDVPTRGRQELTEDGYKLWNERENSISERDNQDVSYHGWREISSDKHKPHSNGEDSLLRREHWDHSSRGRREVGDDGHKPKRDHLDGLSNGGWEHIKDAHKQCNGGEDTALESYNGDISIRGRPGVTPSFTRRRQVKTDGIDVPVAVSGHNQNSPKNHSQSINNITEKNKQSLKPFSNNIVPPPYIKPRVTKYGTNSEAQWTSSDNNEVSSDPPISNRDVMRKNSEWTENRLDHVDHGVQLVGPARVNGYGDEKDHLDDFVGDAKPRPRSVRRRHLKPPPGHDSIASYEHEEPAKRNPSVRKEEARRGLQTLFDDDCNSKYEEEKMMDKLLLHYSKKPSTYEPSKVRKGLKAPPPHDSATDARRPPRHRSRDEAHLNTGLGHPPARAVSLPPEPTAPTEVSRGPARAKSFQPDGQAGHVHPKLPDYDELAARVAALRGA